ncbi:MAG TPA: pyridoxal phosphate-dependent aminotransferase [Thermoanaerobaculia bacterium]
MEEIADLGLGHLRIGAPTGIAAGEYGPPQGFSNLREAVAAWEGVPIDEVCITTGASLGIVAALAGLQRPCSILCPRPFYPAYPQLAELLGHEILFYDLDRERSWQPDPADLPGLLRADTRALLWNFPSNPTGAVPDPETLAVVREVVQGAGLLVLSDEVYADFLYGGTVFPDMRSALGPAWTVRVRSFSKVLGMAGERLGYVIAHPDRLSRICRSHWLLAMSPPAAAQAMALAGIRTDPLRRIRELRDKLSGLRDLVGGILAQCDRIRFTAPPAGIFYWIEVLDCPIDSRTLARACATEAGVVVQPGVAFGIEHPVYLRASFAVEREEVARGFEALTDFLSRLPW